MGEPVDRQVARAWLLLGGYENDRSDSIAANTQYDRAGVLVRSLGDPAGAPGQTAPPPAGGQEPHAGLPPSRVPNYGEVVNRGMANPGTWVFLSDVSKQPDTAPVMRFVYWDDDSDTWRRFAACPDCFQPYTVQQPWRSLAAAEPSRGSGPGSGSGCSARARGGGGYAPNLTCLQAVGRRSSEYASCTPQDPPSTMARLAGEAMEANTLSFYRSLGREPPAWDFLPTAAQFICASTAALCANGAGEATPGDRRASGAGPSAPGDLRRPHDHGRWTLGDGRSPAQTRPGGNGRPSSCHARHPQ